MISEVSAGNYDCFKMKGNPRTKGLPILGGVFLNISYFHLIFFGEMIQVD